MSNDVLTCKTEKRRHVVRHKGFYGLDYVEIVEPKIKWGKRATLRVYFLGKAPEKLNKAHLRIDGGRRVPTLKPEQLTIHHSKRAGRDDYMDVEVITPIRGDFSTYTLWLVDLDDEGRQTNDPHPDFDPRYAQVQFSFRTDCASELDCKSDESALCLPERLSAPDLNYLAKDYASFRRLILDRLALTMPGWTERHVPDIGITLVELLAYVGDHLSYYQDAVATEAYLDTARQRISVRRHARLIDYQIHEGCNARAWLCLEVNSDLKKEQALNPEEIYFITGKRQPILENYTHINEDDDDFKQVPAHRYEVFEPLMFPRYELAPGDIRDWKELIKVLCGTNPLDQYLWNQLPEKLQQDLVDFSQDTTNGKKDNKEDPRVALLRELNRMLQDVSLVSWQIVGHEFLEQKPELSALIQTKPQGKMLIYLNRWLLELAYPTAIRSSRLIELYEAHNKIEFYTWDDSECCLPRGATSATLMGHLHGTALPKISEPEVEQKTGGKKRDETDETDEDEDSSQDQTNDTPEGTLYLRPGDVLIFEEVLGSKSGIPADADPAHRHAVRLTGVSQSIDPLNGQPVVEISWAEADKLPFPLCLSAVGGQDCHLIKDISIARGNILLVDHGRRVGPEDLGVVPAKSHPHVCAAEESVADLPSEPARYRPRLDSGPLVFRQPLLDDAPASSLLKQDPRQALPNLRLSSWNDPFYLPHPGSASIEKTLEATETDEIETEKTLQAAKTDETRLDVKDPSISPASRINWQPQPDLMRSLAGDHHVVVEVDNEGHAQLRFGDGELGRKPAVDDHFEAVYRVGGGPAGHVGAEMISLLVTRFGYNPLDGISLTTRNPFPAQGGIAPEPMSDVKQYASFAFRQKLQRAITAADYAELAQQYPGVQRAAAQLRWTGSWYEALVVIDLEDEAEADPVLLSAIEDYLYPFRRIGHDLVVRQAHNVPLDIEMEVCVKAGYLAGHVKAALLNTFSSRRRADGTLGYFHPDNVSFDDDITLSNLVGVAQSVPGVESVNVTKLDRYGELPSDALTTGILNLGPLEIPRLDNDPNFPENGKIEFVMKGGR